MSIFDSVQTANPGYNKFDLSYDNTYTCRMGYMIPNYIEDILPGDKFRVKTNIFARLMPLATPAFGNLRIIQRFFFVPYRLLMPNNDWEDFITGGTLDGRSSLTDTSTLFPKISFNGVNASTLGPLMGPGSLSDFLGINFPNNEDYGITSVRDDAVYVSQLRHRAYHKIYNDWYRDESIDKEFEVFAPTVIRYDNVGGVSKFFDFHRVNWHKDYFTSALISPTNGQQALLPLVANDLSVLGNFATDLYTPESGYAPISVGTDGNLYAEYGGQQNGPLNSSSSDGNGLYADTANAYMASIVDLRRSIATQRFLEISARGGNRYIEQIFAHFGVRSLDARLQRAEFLGGGITPISIGEVLQTSATNVEGSDTPLGEMAGRGVAYGNDNLCQFTATEHGILMGIMTIHPEAYYFQGISRHLQKFDRLDYYWPSFAHIGDQVIKQGELFFNPSNQEENDKDFGYSPRYAEYKFHANELHGNLKTTMFNWTFAREFANAPKLNSEFLQVPNVTNPFADQTLTQKFIIHASHKVSALRKMPYYGNPSLIG